MHFLNYQVLLLSIYHCGGCYSIPNLHSRGYCCKTNLPSNVAFRGFGVPQGMFIAEHILGNVAEHLGKPRMEVQELNLQKAGEPLMIGRQGLHDNNLIRCWQECVKNSCFQERNEMVKQFNKLVHKQCNYQTHVF